MQAAGRWDEAVALLAADAADRALVHGIIYDELCLGRVEDTSRVPLLAVARRLLDRGTEGVILGCEAALRFALEDWGAFSRRCPGGGRGRPGRSRAPRRSR